MNVELLFDIVSPYSYLCATQLEARVSPLGVGVTWTPVFLGGIAKALGNKMPLELPSKARFMLADLGDWAELYGVPLRTPKVFPVLTLVHQRMLTAAPDVVRGPLAKAFFKAYWGEGHDVSKREVIDACLREVGVLDDALVAAADTQPVKDTLKAATDDALKRGAFGVPTMFIGDRMFWGNDRLDLLVRHIEKLQRARA